jgi:hypothetical protein
MKIFLTILLLVLAVFIGIQGYRRVTQSREDYALKESGQAPATPTDVVNPRNLSGLPAELEPELDKAMAAGPAMFKQWIIAWQPRIADPRLAWIQLDYCEKIAFSNPTEARDLFKQIKARVPVNSPVFPRIRKLEPTLE